MGLLNPTLQQASCAFVADNCGEATRLRSRDAFALLTQLEIAPSVVRDGLFPAAPVGFFDETVRQHPTEHAVKISRQELLAESLLYFLDERPAMARFVEQREQDLENQGL
jgi:hypothetical protein